ncbi:hypothetical protein [Sulfuriflexus mobilis]|uniref:hypothetical protein n=1 Tax=Sulfuriflexus mobilis TaxID=1811807 RepID=UPI000F82328A|nr:hypothetical protein [Sulfuriflexus mobilis]
MANKYYIQFNVANELVTRFDSHSSHLPHPAGTVEVSKTVWDQTVQETDGIWKRDPVTGDITKHPLPLMPLAALQKQGKARVDAAAEQARMQFITPGSGQAIVYELKRAELMAYEAAGSPVATDYPLMNERATRKGMTLAQVATEWRAKVDVWTGYAAQIEGLREGAKEAIDAVVDDASAQANIDAIVNGITWPAPV